MDCENIIERSGPFGLYQKLLGAFLCFFIAPFVAFNNLTQFLIFLVPDCKCNQTFDRTLSKDWIQYSDNRTVHSFENITHPIYGYEYDFSLIYPTIVSENDWVCNNSWKLYFAHSVYWTGSLFGVLIIGNISDKYGRVPAIATCHLIGGIAGTTTIFFSHNFIILLISRAFMGFVVLSQGMFAVVLVMEYVGNDGRMIISTLFLFSYSITATCLPWIAYYLKNWKILAVITSVPLFIVPIICMYIPESLRWLASKGKLSEAKDAIKIMSKLNGKTCCLTDSDLNSIKFEKIKSESMIKMFSYRRLTLIFILTNVIWMLHNISYTGGNIYAANASDNPFLMLSINSAIDVFATYFSNTFSNSKGRKVTTIVSSLGAGFAYFGSVFIPLDCGLSYILYIQLAVVIFGRLSFTVGYNVQYIYAAEVYPTVIRSRALATRLAIGSVGNLVSPQIVQLCFYAKWIPLSIFSLSAFVSAVLMCYLPETLCQSLPETFENGNQFGIKKPIERKGSEPKQRRTSIICVIPLEIQTMSKL